MKLKFVKNNKGFALLFSVLLSSLLLTIGLSIFSISLKELAISTATRQSIHAFFAADSGREQALYEDIKSGSMNFDPAQNEAQTFLIGSETGPVSVDANSDQANFYVVVTKSWHDSNKTKVDTTIDAYGHDSTADDRVERAIEQNY